MVHRSQQDPLIADETAPQHVLLETVTPNQIQNQKKEVKLKLTHINRLEMASNLRSKLLLTIRIEMIF